MLLEFRVSNYRSIKDEQVLSLVAFDKDAQRWDSNVYTTHNIQIPQALSCIALYGPNASGKSNLIQAMAFFQSMIRDSATLVQPGQLLNTKTFAFDSANIQQASIFEITFVLEGIRYQYGFALTPERIEEEWLLVYKTAKPQEWYSRTWNSETKVDEYSFSKTYFTGNKDVWKQSTRQNALFFSTAVILNSEQLKPLWNWVVNNWTILPSNAPLLIQKSIEFLEAPATQKQIYDFLNSADFGIEEISIKKQKVKQQGFQMDLATGQTKILDQSEVEQAIPFFIHHGIKGKASLAFADESMGTQKHFALAGIVLHALQTGSLLVADELENSLHPLLLRHIVKIFQSKEHNPLGAQLIVTTHNTSLMSSDLFRRDQIWFLEKNTELATIVFSLLDFGGVRSNEVYEKRYLDGRYGAIPILNEMTTETGIANVK